VRQVLLNLAGNAVKFTRRGRVGVAVRMDPANPEFIRCEVTDTGIGVPREKQAKLFQLFSQADSSTTRRFGGSGLGLAISKRLVELMGGEIGLLSEPGKGSTFWFNLPAAPGRSDLLQKLDLAPQTAAEDKEPAEAPGHPAARAHVLLAEDDPVNQELARYLLKRLSCAVDVAPNGREAVELARRRVYDAVFMDCLMPEMDGLEATRQIRRAENGATRVPIIAVTASVFESQRAECLAAGMDDFIEKPIHADMMEKALQKWVFDPGSRPSKTPSPTTRQP
jgi:CheY-like chemotaxis protein